MATARRTYTEIEEIARRLRRQVDIDHLECPDVLSIVERLKKTYPELSLVRVLDEELPESEAHTDCYRKTIFIRESVFQACLRGEGRARLTLAHELGHIVLGHSGTRHRENIHLGTRNERRDEGEAWQFARVFLAPTFMAVGCRTVDELVERFGLSGEAADIRFSQLTEFAKQGIEPSRRWKSRTANPEDIRDGRGRRELPKSVIDFLSEAERRGHAITALDRSDDD